MTKGAEGAQYRFFRRPRIRKNAPVKIVLIYLIGGALWIFASDKLLFNYVGSIESLSFFQTFKGLLFILITAVLLYLLIKRAINQLQSTAGALRENEERLKLALKGSDQSLWDWNVTTGSFYFSPEWAKILGYETDELEISYGSMEKLMHPEGREKTQQIINAHLKGQTPFYEATYRIQSKSGEWRWILALGKVVSRDDSGNPLRVTGTHRDITEQKISEHALQESQRMLSTLMSNLPGMAYRCKNDPYWTMEFVSEGCYSLCGYPSDDMVGNTKISFAELIIPEDREKVKRAVDFAVAHNRPFEIVYRINTASNQQKWVWEKGRAVGFENGHPVLLEGFITDITDKVEAEKALAKSEERYRTVVDHVKEIIFHTDLNGCWTFLNSVWADITGYSVDESIGRQAFDFFLPEDVEKNQNEFRKIIDGKKESCQRESRYLTKKGENRWCLIHAMPRRDETGKIIGTLGTLNDIHQRKLVEEALKIRNLQYENFIQNNLVGIWRLEFPEPIPTDLPSREIARKILKTGYFTEANNAMITMYGSSSAEQWIRKPVGDLIVDFEKSLDRVEGVVKNDFKAEIIDNEEQDSEGNIHYFRNSYFGYVENNQLHWLWGIQLDLTQQRRLEEQYRQAQKMEAVGKLAGGIAHDFNNLMTVVTAYGELLLNQLDNKEQLINGITAMKKAGERATSLTRQLLTFSRRQLIQPEIVNLNTIVNDVSKMLKRLIGEDIELQSNLTPDLHHIKIDPGQMEQVIMNLAVNSRDAMPSGGKLTIETQNVNLDVAYARKHIEVEPGKYVLLAVSDTGIGMDEQTRERIFEPFFTTKEKEQGTGLGLSTVYGIVKQGKGSIWVYSELGKGTTFKIYFPAVEKVEKPLASSSGTASSFSGNETILLAEDEEPVRQLLKNILHSNGYNVLETKNINQVIELTKIYRGKIDLLVSDVIMPGMSGPELADKCKEFRSELKVLYVSGYAENAVVHHGVLATGVHFLQKPFTADKLLKKVREVLDSEE